MMKHTCDAILAAIGFVLCWPLFCVIAIAIKLDSRGPILFKQVRVGKGFQPFSIYKFRSMVHDAPLNGGPITVGQDPRITRVGRFLRRFKLDELPQLMNVLRGEMSLVGPRPEIPSYVELFRCDFQELLTVRPGVTDLASLKYINEATLLEKAHNPEEKYTAELLPEKIRLGKFYLQHASFVLDLAIIAQTLLRLIRIPIAVCDIPELLHAPSKSRYTKGNTLKSLVLKWRRPVIVFLDLILIVLANYLAFWLRFDGSVPTDQTLLFTQMLPWLILIRGITFSVFRLNEGLWRYTSIWDLQRILVGVATSSVIFYCLVHWVLQVTEYPRSVYVMDSILLVGLLTGIRLPSRLIRDKFAWRTTKRVLIVGAGDFGERIVREMKTNPSFHYKPIGFVDDQSSLVGQRIHGVQVLGTPKDLSRLIEAHKPEEIVLALPEAGPAHIRQIVASLDSFKIPIKTLPNVNEILADKIAVSQIRNLSFADLLPRAPVHSKTEVVSHLIAGKRVLITGAGGSIGSELSRQIASLEPEALILYERHENSLYTISKELVDRGWSSIVHPVIGDVTDVGRLHCIMKQYRPTIMFHAAAHKHVPLMECNASEAFKNNCVGTRIAAEAAEQFKAERFVLISSDKAVNPSSVMGASKRVAELVVQHMAERNGTRFITVRFGNVLGSNGSVVLRFQEQIASGGPVTVTHPAVQRFFMLTSEAVHLVLQAASLGEQGAIYVLDMGEQIRVLDLARNLIRLSGFVPDQEIPISFIGLRPGEKLYEELTGDGETAEPSPIENILRIRSNLPITLQFPKEKLKALEQVAVQNHSVTVIERLREILPGFQFSGFAVSGQSSQTPELAPSHEAI